ncbi:HipA domain-containing protein [Stenotrophomonas sp. GD04145]|uniref:HipA domain-containing protein n=1 Tax=Stenotrophomonas sp. GD04145 TaxID=2975436 RepID=UPI0024480288|nr:HipA domain-containing protein [Stenotrophomonas sp. GD04145]MDH0170975.1 HipA domain-containing protein [Stenotrophomonas sp. GD04145]
MGSSPGGEQPKFTATVEHDGGRYAALVKFALPGAGEAAERWADLLVCEHLALEVLREAGVSAAESSLIQTDSHSFLEVKRFDRSPGTLGRRGFVSLLALSSAYVGDVTMDWGQAGEQLRAQRWIHQETTTALSRLHAFGQLIGNTNMHQGNVGFHLLDRGALPLAPAYDMLPMSLAPSRTGVLRATTPLPPGRTTARRPAGSPAMGGSARGRFLGAGCSVWPAALQGAARSGRTECSSGPGHGQWFRLRHASAAGRWREKA